MDTHCKIGRVSFKGPRIITTRLPKKALQVALELRALTDKKREAAA